eukprot:Nitzschia sp. Nitz4//scaffold24_size164493//108180//108713//NITZ4_002338-RA/size164493-processed-gene-0.206-mRNA-1//1//CDS//3329544144//5757//frame0
MGRKSQVAPPHWCSEGHHRSEQDELQSSLYAEYYQFGRINAGSRRSPRSYFSDDDNGTSTTRSTNPTPISPPALNSPLTATLLQEPLLLPYSDAAMEATPYPFCQFSHGGSSSADNASSEDDELQVRISHQRNKKRRARQLIDHALSIAEEVSFGTGEKHVPSSNRSIKHQRKSHSC